jgi:hypothetical protein
MPSLLLNPLGGRARKPSERAVGRREICWNRKWRLGINLFACSSVFHNGWNLSMMGGKKKSLSKVAGDGIKWNYLIIVWIVLRSWSPGAFIHELINIDSLITSICHYLISFFCYVFLKCNFRKVKRKKFHEPWTIYTKWWPSKTPHSKWVWHPNIPWWTSHYYKHGKALIPTLTWIIRFMLNVHQLVQIISDVTYRWYFLRSFALLDCLEIA